jgi:predicted hotdog family 3-hydroxylacyl-ACP dehydratase
VSGAALDGAQLRALLPHAGNMCLIEEVLSWDARGLHARTRTHLDCAHPLRRNGKLDALHLIEYGAQAMALHGGLCARARGQRAAPGWLAAVREFRCAVERLDDLAAPLEVYVEQLHAGARGWLYAVRACCGARELGGGRIGVMPAPQSTAGPVK